MPVAKMKEVLTGVGEAGHKLKTEQGRLQLQRQASQSAQVGVWLWLLVGYTFNKLKKKQMGRFL